MQVKLDKLEKHIYDNFKDMRVWYGIKFRDH
jgi:hypothetical protein